MSLRFRQYLKKHDFSCRLREDNQAAPPASANAAPPDNPDAAENKTNKNHFAGLKFNLGISDSDFDAAIEGDSIQLYKVPDYSRSWGFWVIPPVTASVQKLDSGNYQVTYQLEQKYQMNPRAFILPYKQGETPRYYEGPVRNQTVTMNEEELADGMAQPYKSAGAAPPMPGGMPPGGM